MICNRIAQMSRSVYQDASVRWNSLLPYMSMPLGFRGLDTAKENFFTIPAGFNNIVQWNAVLLEILNKAVWGKGRECLVCIGLPVKYIETQDFHRFSSYLTIALLSKKAVKAWALPSASQREINSNKLHQIKRKSLHTQRSHVPLISCNSILKGVSCPRKALS